ncbi:MAG: YeeE/YedE family protein [Aestuariivirga sp.]|nr:YeeE/YedE family protein [Aestuariivirga sp.]
MGKLIVFISGVLFGTGVTVSGMVNPMKVLNFLDISGAWDPTLILVMGAALLVTLIGYQIIFKRKVPLFASFFRLPTSQHIDAKLLGGAALFGVGWGLSGFCPGPAVASLVFGRTESITFVIAMAAGMILATQIQKLQRSKAGQISS